MRLPVWIKAKHNHSELRPLKSSLRGHGLSTVCEEARCPNRAECFSKPTATFLILGRNCTRDCGFCSVRSSGPDPVDHQEPRRVALAARQMGLRYVVVTSVTRDDLHDGGAGHFARTIEAVRAELPGAVIEVLTPDFKGMTAPLRAVLDAGPDVFNHNVETVPRLYPDVRPQADYARSLKVLANAKEMHQSIKTKSGLMVGLGERKAEVLDVMDHLRKADCDFLTVGQYLRPTRRNLPVREYVEPDVFEEYAAEARARGFQFVASAPLVRSSMNAEEMFSRKAEALNV